MRRVDTNKYGCGIKRNISYVGEPLEIILKKIVETNQPIEGGSPIISEERSSGVKPEYDIRTDR